MSSDAFVAGLAPRVRDGLVAAYGYETGVEAAAEAMVWAVENRDRLARMENPAGFLYRVGQSAARRVRRPLRVLPEVPAEDLPDIEPGLVPALEALSEQQRVVVVMVHGFGWPQVEVGEVLGVSSSTVAAHLRRGMESLRGALEVTVDGR